MGLETAVCDKKGKVYSPGDCCCVEMVFMLVRSFREANLDMLIVAMKGIVPLYFTLDHVHYTLPLK